MELNRQHFRAFIYYDFKSGLSQQQCLERLQSAFPDSAPSRATILNWFSEFKRGRATLEDGPRPGRPCDAVTVENVNRVRDLVNQDRRITYCQLQEAMHLSSSTINSILHEKLGLRKLAARWVPHLLTLEQKERRLDFCRFMLGKFDGGSSKSVSYIVTGDETWIYQYDPETKQQSTVWVFDDEDPPTKVVRSQVRASKCWQFSSVVRDR
jgi:histone-lysine N-methyltransferase SETMAR